MNERDETSTPVVLATRVAAALRGGAPVTAADAAALRALAVEHRLAVYGTLAPGGSNHAQLGGLRGTWRHGTVRGRRALRTFPVFTWDEQAPVVAVQLFESTDLPAHWARLDAFEGADYRRIPVPVPVPADRGHNGGVAIAWLYEAVVPVP